MWAFTAVVKHNPHKRLQHIFFKLFMKLSHPSPATSLTWLPCSWQKVLAVAVLGWIAVTGQVRCCLALSLTWLPCSWQKVLAVGALAWIAVTGQPRCCLALSLTWLLCSWQQVLAVAALGWMAGTGQARCCLADWKTEPCGWRSSEPIQLPCSYASDGPTYV